MSYARTQLRTKQIAGLIIENTYISMQELAKVTNKHHFILIASI